MSLPAETNKYTYADYLTWDDGVRYELIDGIAYALAAPVIQHQRISGEIFRQLANFLTGKPCEVFSAPFDVRLNADGADDVIVEPDILVVCDKSKLADGKSCKGAPDIIFEILSPSSEKMDTVIKFYQYQKAGVREYWKVDPDTKSVHKSILKDNGYFTCFYREADLVPVDYLAGCVINLADVFSEPV